MENAIDSHRNTLYWVNLRMTSVWMFHILAGHSALGLETTLYLSGFGENEGFEKTKLLFGNHVLIPLAELLEELRNYDQICATIPGIWSE